MKFFKGLVGKTKEDKEIHKYTIINDNGLTVSILNLGGIICEILAPDREGKLENVVLAYDNIKDYEDNPYYLGCIIGRTAGRISKGEFAIDGERFSLELNNGNNNIHGGIKGFGRVLWEATEIINKESIALILNYSSPHLEEGFPGNLKVTVIYELNNKNELILSYRGVTDRKTIINLTNHSYFNLSGNLKEDINEHYLSIDANAFIELNQETLPTGEILDVESTIFDFRNPKWVGRDIGDNSLRIFGGYDHPYIITPSKDPSIILLDKKSGRYMEITTDQSTVILYTGNYLNNEIVLQGGVRAYKHLGLCLETQDYPDAPNQVNFPCNIFDYENDYYANTIYRFGTLGDIDHQ